MDATIMRSFQIALFSRFLPWSYAGHVNLTASKHWLFMPNCKHGSTVELNIFIVQDFLSAVSNIMIILLSGAMGYNVIGVYR